MSVPITIHTKHFLLLLLTIDFTMILKYQSEIDKLNLKNCPSNVSPPKEEIIAFRFSFNPIDHEHNFLPNVLIDEIKNAPFNHKGDETLKCLRCGASFFLSQEAAINRWKNLGIRFKENYGYTHIAFGSLTEQDGLMNEPARKHFTFYILRKYECRFK